MHNSKGAPREPIPFSVPPAIDATSSGSHRNPEAQGFAFGVFFVLLSIHSILAKYLSQILSEQQKQTALMQAQQSDSVWRDVARGALSYFFANLPAIASFALGPIGLLGHQQVVLFAAVSALCDLIVTGGLIWTVKRRRRGEKGHA
jgi:undecaprenyl pyrophosphate phosphatase UppP